MKKYICYGGTIISKNDGDKHYIYPNQVAMLYGVNPMDFYYVRDDEDRSIRGLKLEGLISLFPKSNGDYSLARNP